jgi:hypothetical protein
MEGFSSESETRLREYVKTMNEMMGGKAFSDDDRAGSPITIRMVSQFSSSSASADGSTGSLRIAGRATLSSDECVVEIADFVANDPKNQLLEPVTMHELGHCGGLRHTAAGLMAPTTLAWPTYSDSDKSDFVDEFLASISSKN